MTKSRLIWTLTGFAAMVPALAQERPNVVLFVVDDMGPMDTSVPFLTGEQGVPLRFPLNDWYQTPNMERLTGAQVPESHPVDGQDLTQLLSGADDPAREEVFLCHFPHQHRGSYYSTWRNGPWKLIYYYNPAHPESPQCVLFNLEKDPYETSDVLKDNPDTARRLLREMTARLARENAAYPVDFEGNPILPDPDLL